MPEATSADYNLLDGSFRVRQAETREQYTGKKEAAKRPFHDRLDGDSEEFLPPATEGRVLQPPADTDGSTFVLRAARSFS